MAEAAIAWLAESALATSIASATGFTAAQVATAMFYTSMVVGSAAYGSAQQRKAARAARSAYNASLQDRQVMIRSAIAPRRVVYGRTPVSGVIAYLQSTGTQSEYLHLVVTLAGHEIDAVEKIWCNDVELPTPDANGFITSGDFAKSTEGAEVHSWQGSASSALPQAPAAIVSVTSTVTVGTGEASYSVTSVLDVGTGYTLAGSTVTIVAYDASAQYVVNYTTTNAVTLVRIRTFLGGAGQVAASELVSESGGKWTSAHVGNGVAYLYVRLKYDQDVFGQVGVPNIKALVRGKKVRDPRTGLTAWSENSALCVADYLRDSALGLGCTAGEVPDADIIAAANVCDETVATDGGGGTQKRYTTNGSFDTDMPVFDNLQTLLDPMAGAAVWVQGRWLVRAGAWRTPEASVLTEDWLADGSVQIFPRAPRMELFNGVSGTFVDAARDYAEAQFPPVDNATYRAADGGRRVVREVQMPMVDHGLRAQRIAKIMLERSRQALTVRLPCNLRAYNLVPTDVLHVTLARYGWTNKNFEVMQREWTPGGGVVLTLRETASGVFAWNYGEATTIDLAPNTDLPDALTPPAALTGVTVTSGTAQLLRMADGAIVTRGLVQWTLSTEVFVVQGGTIQIEWKLDNAATWEAAPAVPGDSTSAYISPLTDQRITVVRVRPVNSAGRVGDWTYVVHDVVGKTAAPNNVSGLAAATVVTGVRLTWNAAVDADYEATEIKVGATYAGATLLWRGAGSDTTVVPASNGTYTYWAVHVDTSGNRSATPASVTHAYTASTAGSSNAQVNLYQRTATSTPPSVSTTGNTTYTFATGGVSGQPSGWSNELPTSGGGWRWVIQQQASSTSATAVLPNTGWSTPRLLAEDGATGGTGTNGTSTYTLEIFSSGLSATPTSTTATYTFSTDTFTPGNLTSGWTRAQPTPSGTTPIYRSAYTFSTTTPGTPVTAGTWSAPVVVVQKGADGAAGSNGVNGTRTAILDVYRWASSTPVTFPSGSSTYTWATGQFTAPATLNGWALTPGSGAPGQTLYIARQVYADTGTSSTSSVTWATSTAIPVGAAGADGSDGADGANGTRTAFLELYQWAASAPTSFPSGSSTYTWATGTFTLPATPNGWALAPGAAVAGQTLWGCSVRYSDTGTSATSAVTWSASAAYAVGAAGSNGTRTALLRMYRWATSRPTTYPAGSSTYTWATGQFTAPATLNGWTLAAGLAVPGSSLWAADVVFADSGTSATSAVTWPTTPTLTQLGVAGDANYPVQEARYLARVWLQQASKPATPTGGSYNFEAGSFNAPSGGWSSTQPTTGANPAWVCQYEFASADPYATITAGAWTEPTNDAENDGAGNPCVYVLRLYALSATEPLTPTSSTTTYTISTDSYSAGDISTSPSWSRTRSTATASDSVWCTEVRIETTTPASAVTIATDTLVAFGRPSLVHRLGSTKRIPIKAHGGTYGISQAWNDQYANRVVRNHVMGEALTTTLASTALNYIGDEVTLTTGTTTVTKTWTGAAWASNPVYVSGDLIAGGTISAGVSLNTSGYVKAEGNSSTNVNDPQTGSTTATGVVGAFNTSNSDNYGIFASTNSTSKVGVYAYNASATAGYALRASGYSGIEVFSRGTTSATALKATAGIQMNASGMKAVHAIAYGSSSYALYAEGNVDVVTSQRAGAIYASGHVNIESSGVLTITVATGTAPMVISSTTKVANLNADLLDGKDWATPDPLGASTPNSVRASWLHSTGYDANGANLRMKTGTGTSGIGAFLRNDGSSLYLLLTASNDADGSWTSARPWRIDFTSGRAYVDALGINQTPATSSTNAATFSGLLPSGYSAQTNKWVEIETADGTYAFPAWKKV